jgi:excisionase family DNA binding protein
VSALLQAIFADLEADPVAREKWRSLLGAAADQRPASSTSVYTVQSLAAELGRTKRSILGAIERGELEAAKRGRGYIISAEAVTRWASPMPEAPARRAAARRPKKTKASEGPMRRALGGRSEV